MSGCLGLRGVWSGLLGRMGRRLGSKWEIGGEDECMLEYAITSVGLICL